MTETDYDLVIVGGAFSGASMGTLLRRYHPGAKVLIIEKSTKFDRKVGESTSEVAGCFMTKILGIQSHLMRNHLVKQGLRLWFTKPENDSFECCGEIGPFYQGRLPTYQLERALLDQHLLELAQEGGCELLRPAKVKDVDLGGVGKNRITVATADNEVREITAKWVVDATGKAAWLARDMGMLKRQEDHPINSVWCRFLNAKDFDCQSLRGKYLRYARTCKSPRGSATNHLMGKGWWCWIIPLLNGEVSAGICYDSRIFELPEGRNLSERLMAHLRSHPVGEEIFGESEAIEGDARAYSHLPQYSEKVAGDGWAMVGDAAGFMDPLYSQGLDYCGHSICCVLDMVRRSLSGKCVKMRIEEFNQEYRKSYQRWYEALYKDKYYYLGDAELMKVAFLLDLSCYYIGPVFLAYNRMEKEFRRMPFSSRGSTVFYHFMKFYNHRLSQIAKRKMAAGRFGEENLEFRYLVPGFSPDGGAVKMLGRGLWHWMGCELKALRLPRPKTEMVPREKMEQPTEPPVADSASQVR